jgi:membrane-bound lytic murein transglycosylase B
MADPVQDPIVETPAGTGGADPSAVLDPRDARLAELEDYAARAQATFEKLKPFEEDIQAIAGDEGYREFQRTSRKSYYQMLEEQKKAHDAEIPESEKRLLSALDERLGKFKPVLDDYESRAQAQTRTAKEASEKFTQENLEYAQRLIAEQKLTPEEVQDLGRFAKAIHDDTVAAGAPRFVGLEEAYKRTYGRAETKSAAPTPKSLRAKAGATGVPGASKPVDDRADLAKAGGVTRHMLSVLNSQRKTG